MQGSLKPRNEHWHGKEGHQEKFSSPGLRNWKGDPGVDKVDEIYQNRKVSSHGRRQHSNGEITQMLELTDKDFNAATIKCYKSLRKETE